MRPVSSSGPLLDAADDRVAVLHGRGKLARLKRRAHAAPFARRDAAVEHERLGAAADAAVQRMHHDLAIARRPPALQRGSRRGRAPSPRTLWPHPACVGILMRYTRGYNRRSCHRGRAREHGLPSRWLAGARIEAGATYPLKAAAVFAVMMAAVTAVAGEQHPYPRFGPANHVTMIRAMLVALVAALIGHPATPAMLWCVIGSTALMAALDGLDGWLARRTPHGERVRRAVRHGNRRAADPGAVGPRLAAREGRRLGAAVRADAVRVRRGRMAAAVAGAAAAVDPARQDRGRRPAASG